MTFRRRISFSVGRAGHWCLNVAKKCDARVRKLTVLGGARTWQHFNNKGEAAVAESRVVREISVCRLPKITKETYLWATPGVFRPVSNVMRRQTQPRKRPRGAFVRRVNAMCNETRTRDFSRRI